jgi:hypothetical protein
MTRLPRSVRAARRRGWHVVTVKRSADVSWLGQLIRIQRVAGAVKFVNSYDGFGGGQVAFEDPNMATVIQLKFG